MRTLAPRERKLIAVGLLVLVVGLAWLLIAAPVLAGFQARRDEREALVGAWRRDQHLLQAIPLLRAEALDQRRTGRDFKISAPSASQAAEALKQRLNATLTASGGQVSGLQEVRADIPAGWVSARADARITLTQLDDSLRRLQNDKPYLVVEYTLVGADRPQSQYGSLDVRLQVSALVRAAPPR
ncbi:type II secretion system protein GspM [Caulobacter sp.]|uniref:type II secretion system protein GspM n=1 Tax=Caulobacter sp. TaxID=78 RepID=UPI003BB0B05D